VGKKIGLKKETLLQKVWRSPQTSYLPCMEDGGRIVGGRYGSLDLSEKKTYLTPKLLLRENRVFEEGEKFALLQVKPLGSDGFLGRRLLGKKGRKISQE